MGPRSDPPFGSDGPASNWGLHLPPAAYSAIERYHPGRINALAIYCSDGRWGAAFDEFCHRHLRAPRYDRWAAPGGPAWLAMPPEGADLTRAILVQLDFLVEVHELERVMLITHYGCAWYGRMLNQGPDDCLASQAEDMTTATAMLRGRYPTLKVEAYLAMRRQDWVSFHPLETGEDGR